jgi:hypothetical protein
LVFNIIGSDTKACKIVKGYFPQSINEEHKKIKYSLVSLDCDLYEPMKSGLNYFYPLLQRGGMLILHDYSSLCWLGAKQAIDEFIEVTNEYLILMPDKSGTAIIRKSK